MEEIATLKALVPSKVDSADGHLSFTMQRYLDSMTAYAETIVEGDIESIRGPERDVDDEIPWQEEIDFRSQYKWDVKFSERRLMDIETQNVPYIRLLGDIDVDEDIISIIMTEHDKSDGDTVQTGTVSSFCAGVSLPDLLAGVGDAGSRPIAWLDEQDYAGEKRSSKSPLTAQGLYGELSREVRRERLRPPQSTPKFLRLNNSEASL